jgi:hypothetical protein
MAFAVANRRRQPPRYPNCRAVPTDTSAMKMMPTLNPLADPTVPMTIVVSKMKGISTVALKYNPKPAPKIKLAMVSAT